MDSDDLAEKMKEFTPEQIELGQRAYKVSRRLRRLITKSYPNLTKDQARELSGKITFIMVSLMDFSLPSVPDGPISHMDVANALVSTCVRNNTCLEDLHAGRTLEALKNPKWSRITDEEMERLNKEIAANVADFLLVLESLRADRELQEYFLRGALRWATYWERNRVNLRSPLTEGDGAE